MASYSDDRPLPPARGASVREGKNGQGEKKEKKGFFGRRQPGKGLVEYGETMQFLYLLFRENKTRDLFSG